MSWWKLSEIWKGNDPDKKNYNRVANLDDPEPKLSFDETIKVYKDRLPYLKVAQTQYPHCNQFILHPPMQCTYCDAHPLWQQERVDNKVSFTGHETPGWMKCPADLLFNIKNNTWHGNQVVKDITDEPL